MLQSDIAVAVGVGPSIESILNTKLTSCIQTHWPTDNKKTQTTTYVNLGVGKNDLAASRSQAHREEALSSVAVEGEGELSTLSVGVWASTSGAVLRGIDGAVSAGSVERGSTIITVRN